MRSRRPNRNKKKKKSLNEIVSLDITTLGGGGDGIGTHKDKPVYVPKTMPGDKVTAVIDKASAGGFMARLQSVDTPSPDRATPTCPHFDACGGCDVQHLSQDTYRNWKIEKVKTTLERADIRPKLWGEPIFMEAATRRRTMLSVMRTGGKLHLGYYAPRSHNIISIEHCSILSPELDSSIQAMRPFLLRLAPDHKTVSIVVQMTGGLDVMLVGGDWQTNGQFSLEQHETLAEMSHALDLSRLSFRETDSSAPEVLISRNPIMKDFGALCVNLPPAAFLQASDTGENTLVDHVIAHAKGTKNAVDLFCGCGTFAGSLLKEGITVHGVDSAEDAVNALSATNHPHLTTQLCNLFQEPLTTQDLNTYDLAVFDPPRAGAKAQVESLAHSDVPRIIAVSCNPSTFVRDATVLIEDGDYTLESLQIIDQFVFSSHVELVALFTRD